MFKNNLGERDYNLMDLGQTTKVLLDLHLQNPKKFSTEFIIEQLFTEYERMGFGQEND